MAMLLGSAALRGSNFVEWWSQVEGVKPNDDGKVQKVLQYLVVRKESNTKYIEICLPQDITLKFISIHILLHNYFKLLEKAFQKAWSN